MNNFIKTVRDFAYSEIERTGMPLRRHVDLSCEKAMDLAEKLGADKEVVEAGSLLMDCVIGKAMQEGRILEHVQMCLEKTDEFLRDSNLSEEIKANIRRCVSEHHGVDSFYSLESEICCNADCYKFSSIKGFLYAVRFLRDMPLEDFIKLLRNKFNEKKDALTLDTCKEELQEQLATIDSFITHLED